MSKKMSKFYLLVSVGLMVGQVSRACDEGNEEEQLAAARYQSEEYFAKAYGYDPVSWNALYYPKTAQVPGYDSPYEGRTVSSSLQSRIDPRKKYYGSKTYTDELDNQPEGRFALGGLGASIINTGLFNNRFTPANTWRPFANFANRIPVSYNPNFDNPLDTFDACTSPSGDAGICVPGSVCSLFRGRPSGSCVLGKVCCVNAVTACGGTVTLNNTYWQSPTTPVSASSTCALTIKLDTKFVEQLKKPICQIRLDFVSFTTAQPTLGTCVDTFQVGGSSSTVPSICGDNSGQHMYLDVQSSALTPTDVQLIFNFGTGTTTRSWNIKIALLPCGASYLAPTDCLQYYTSSTGKVKSFNWQDTTGGAIRQLNNQNYNICFRTEFISGQRATQMCLSICSVANGGDPFSITTPAAVIVGNANNLAISTTAAQVNVASPNSNVGTTVSNTAGNTLVATCLYDFLLIAGARDATGVEADRYCGNQLNPAVGTALVPGAATSVQVCTPVKPFRMTYQTDGTEAAIATLNVPTVPAFARADTTNTGFCLDYQEQ
ncbi:uncharacterized protein LOC130689822 [Daphnia carinata]|uniref:uncharacterized protein LOC130689822 n=1 Tax=Daphnia carinata TaxID=120202 RepID=UPI00257D68F8|nr:uncharacterized protein LOC130689822 [Daphnia carinata]